jgi:simple sugar transport system permease protein
MEGLMLIGAFAAIFFAFVTGNPWVGLLAGIIAGGLFSLLHAYATITLHLDHVVSGAVLNILALGLTNYLLILAFGHPGTSDPIPVSLAEYQVAVPVLSQIPVIGPVFFNQRPIVYISFILIIFFTVFLYRAKTGLHVRASGEHPLALETIGVSVYRIRYLAVIISGLTSGLAGAFLSIENSNVFTSGMTGGRGFIALAANISGGWTPVGSFLASLFFGFAEAFQYRLQASRLLDLPSELFVMFPYIATVIAVAGLVRKSRPPKAVGLDFSIEKKVD